MKKIFLSNLLLQLALNLIVKPVYVLGVDRGVQNVIGKEAYGIYFSLLSFSFLFHMLNDFGIQNFTSTHVAKYPHLAQKYFSNLFVCKLLLSSLYVILTLGGAWLIGYSGTELSMLSMLMAVQVISSFLLFFRSNIAALGNYYTDSFFSVFDRILLILLGVSVLGFGFIHPGDSAFLFIIIQIVALGLSTVFAFFSLSKLIGKLEIIFNYNFIRYLLKKGMPYATIVFLMLVYSRSDVVLIERLLPDGKAEAGIFASTYRLLEAVNSIMLIFGTLLLPIFSTTLRKKESIVELLQLSVKIVLFISFTACILVFFYKNEISSLLYRESTPYWANMMGVLFWSYIPLSLMYVMGALMTASDKIKEGNRVFATAVVISLFLNWFLIPHYKSIGAAWVSLFVQSFVALALFLISYVNFKLKPDKKLLLQLLLFFSILLTATHFSTFLIGNWVIKCFFIGTFAVLLSFALRFWSIKSLLKLLNVQRRTI
ncbi:MAG: oligosaccharide flippase family protein [Saprospiraceae bacterium]